MIAKEAIAVLNRSEVVNKDIINEAVKVACEEVTFGSNQRGSKSYRLALAETIISRGLCEVYHVS